MYAIDRVIVTRMPHGRVVALCDHRRARIRKKWSRALIVRPDVLATPLEVIDDVRALARHIEVTERCERHLARHLRRSGMRILTYSRAAVDKMLRDCTWPPRT